MRIPTFSRQSETADRAEAERPATAGSATTPVRPRPAGDASTATDLPPAPPPASRGDLPPAPRPTVAPPPSNPPTVGHRSESERAADLDRADTADLRRPAGTEPAVAAGPKPRASMLATLGLILGVAGALLVLSGPLLGYGIGVAVVALLLSLSGIHATGKRHVAGKTDALIGMVLALAAIVVGVLALTGSLSWLGTDMHPVDTFRHWLDAKVVNRF